jgi:hypothetical protein
LRSFARALSVDHSSLSQILRGIAGIPLDEVNVTIQRLLRKRRVSMTSRDRWVRVEEA